MITPSKCKSFNLRSLLGGLVLCLTVLLAGYLFYHIRSEPEAPTDMVQPAKLPSDVDGMMEGYIFNEYKEGLRTEIKGRRVVRRGRKILGLRMNMAKTNFFDDISGTFRSKKGVTEFSADGAEWDMASTSPLILQGAIRLRVGGQEVPDIRRCRIWLKSGVIEAFTDRSMIFNFK